MIDMKPAPGRIVVMAPDDLRFNSDRLVSGKAYTVTRVSGRRVYYDDAGTERFTYLFAAICDTVEEYASLTEISERMYRWITEARKEAADHWRHTIERSKQT